MKICRKKFAEIFFVPKFPRNNSCRFLDSKFFARKFLLKKVRKKIVAIKIDAQKFLLQKFVFVKLCCAKFIAEKMSHGNSAKKNREKFLQKLSKKISQKCRDFLCTKNSKQKAVAEKLPLKRKASLRNCLEKMSHFFCTKIVPKKIASFFSVCYRVLLELKSVALSQRFILNVRFCFAEMFLPVLQENSVAVLHAPFVLRTFQKSKKFVKKHLTNLPPCRTIIVII